MLMRQTTTEFEFTLGNIGLKLENFQLINFNFCEKSGIFLKIESFPLRIDNQDFVFMRKKTEFLTADTDSADSQLPVIQKLRRTVLKKLNTDKNRKFKFSQLFAGCSKSYIP